MSDKNKKFPEIVLIVAMTESGMVGNGDKLPWKSSLDFEWFKKNTMGFPMIFGKITANGMPVFPLKNRPCAVLTTTGKKMEITQRENGGYLSSGPDVGDNSLGNVMRSFKNFDKIFIAGGISLYSYATRRNKPWIELVGTPDADKPLVDTIVKTVFPDGYVTGDRYLDNRTIILTSEPYFKLVSHQDYTLDSTGSQFYDSTAHHEENPALINMPTMHKLGKNDTPFPTIRFEIWKRNMEHPGK